MRHKHTIAAMMILLATLLCACDEPTAPTNDEGDLETVRDATSAVREAVNPDVAASLPESRPQFSCVPEIIPPDACAWTHRHDVVVAGTVTSLRWHTSPAILDGALNYDCSASLYALMVSIEPIWSSSPLADETIRVMVGVDVFDEWEPQPDIDRTYLESTGTIDPDTIVWRGEGANARLEPEQVVVIALTRLSADTLLTADSSIVEFPSEIDWWAPFVSPLFVVRGDGTIAMQRIHTTCKDNDGPVEIDGMQFGEAVNWLQTSCGPPRDEDIALREARLDGAALAQWAPICL